MDNIELRSMQQYAWQYFLAHAQARLATFRFYLIFCTILGAGLFGILGQQGAPQYGSPLAFLIGFLSYIYWRVDARHRQIVKRAQAALIWAEESLELPAVQNQPHPMMLFAIDRNSKQARTPLRKSFNPFGKLTYSECVNLVFLVFGVGGALAGFALLLAWR